jgi:hypothetical protein
MPTGAKLPERGFGNLSWIATAGGRGDLNDFFGDDVRDRVVAINKIERVQRKRVGFIQPLDLIRLQHVFRKKAIDRYGVLPTTASMQRSYACFVSEMINIGHLSATSAGLFFVVS